MRREVRRCYTVGRLNLDDFPTSNRALRAFADQAVIAIENAPVQRIKEALERQTATSEILRVISQSPTVQPVFETVAAAALKLCRRVQVMSLPSMAN
jgi:hypothetical protein